MKISANDWQKYINLLTRVNVAAATAVQKYINDHGLDDMESIVRIAYAITTKYGEAAAEAACEFYDATAQAQNANVPPAEPAPTPEFGEVAKTVYGAGKQSEAEIPNAIGRLVKRAGADTTLNNAKRDGAQFAWIPHGDPCPFCITLASRGWQYVSKNSLRNGHAEHIHANCNCEYAVRFSEDDEVEGYDPDVYKRIYYGAEGSTPNERINYLRRMNYAQVRGREGGSIEWNGEKLRNLLGGDFGDFKKLVNNSPNRGLYNQYSEMATYTRDGSGYYMRGSTSIHFGLKSHEGMNKYSTLAHEFGHMIDDKMGRVPGLSYTEVDLVNQRCIIGSGTVKTLVPMPSNSDEFLKALREDAAALRPRVADRSIRDEFLSSTVKRNATHGVQDALDAFYSTQDRGILPWGHGDRYFNREYNRRIAAFGNEKGLKNAFIELGFDASNQAKTKRLSRAYEAASEAWANVSSAVTVGGEELESIKQYMPNTYKAYMRIVGG